LFREGFRLCLPFSPFCSFRSSQSKKILLPTETHLFSTAYWNLPTLSPLRKFGPPSDLAGMSTQIALLFALTQAANDLSDAQSHLTAGNLNYTAGRLTAAQAEYRLAVRILDRTPSPELAVALNNLGSTLVALHEYERALPVLRRAAQVAGEFLTKEQSVQIQGNTIQAMIRLGLFATARPLLEEALAYSEARQTSDLPKLILSRAVICIDEADYACAHRDVSRVLDSVDPQSMLAAIAHATRASTSQRLHQHYRAVVEFETAIEIAKRFPGWEFTAEATDILESYVFSLRKAGRRQRAKAILRKINQRKRMDPTP
jgi:tetratricopeptide (TPR) repeat protein